VLLNRLPHRIHKNQLTKHIIKCETCTEWSQNWHLILQKASTCTQTIKPKWHNKAPDVMVHATLQYYFKTSVIALFKGCIEWFQSCGKIVWRSALKLPFPGSIWQLLTYDSLEFDNSLNLARQIELQLELAWL